jgi:hypothetical protein
MALLRLIPKVFYADIAAIYEEVKARAPDVLHPNSKTIQRKPWGAQEFAVLDASTVCVVFRQW